MKEIDQFTNIIRHIRPKRENNSGDYKNALKGNRSNKTKQTHDTSDVNSLLKAKIHKKLQDIDLSTEAGRKNGRKIFIELTLENEFDNLNSTNADKLIANIDNKVYVDSSLGFELDKIVKSLQKSVKNV